MNESPFSVVVPVRNAEETIERALRSLFASTFPPGEVLVVDDGCTDRTIEIARRFPVRVLSPPPPGGVAAARNAGAAESNRPVLFFLDADVMLEPKALATAAGAMEDRTVAVAVGLQSSRAAFDNPATVYKNLWLRHTYEERAARIAVLYSSAVAIRREAFTAVGGFDAHYRKPNIEDSELGKRINEAGHRITVVPGIEFVHMKRYTAPQVMRTDFLRSVGMAKVQFRDRLRRISRENYSSIPTSFLFSCLSPWVALLLFASTGAAGTLWLAPLLASVLNHRWLRSLARTAGPAYLLWGNLFLWLDVVAVNAGIFWGAIEYGAGRKY